MRLKMRKAVIMFCFRQRAQVLMSFQTMLSVASDFKVLCLGALDEMENFSA
jgi:hypothetical protein